MRNILLLLVFMTLGCLTTSSVLANDGSDCLDDSCSIAKLNTLKALSSRGNVEASYALGHLFLSNDSGVRVDLEQAYFYFDRAARYGFLPALRQVGGMLARGVGVEKNLAEARIYMRKAAEKNVDKAAEEFAAIVFSDPSSSSDDKQFALQKLQEEVDKGMSYLANYTLAHLYVEGVHVPQDLDVAQELLAFPASGEYANAKELLETLTDSGEISQQTAPDEAEARHISIENKFERIRVTGIGRSVADITFAVMDQLRLTHGQTGSRIKGNGCTHNMPGCEITGGGKSVNSMASISLR
ncbi:tetratricopeptide repeat protein [Alteromonas oceanisediminis]|uniref:tetratricopeptide repeat protein n=1 Tax=Alteromonas oceanisediminis TaxID=2836180 RepID=UPI001BDA5ECD|nr:tetratricopeptide repeat protein [Alteromonas oceanisediminis]MBT0586065.1 sel1 repeat family protein [Alteromonas oceanisediminis]